MSPQFARQGLQVLGRLLAGVALVAHFQRQTEQVGTLHGQHQASEIALAPVARGPGGRNQGLRRFRDRVERHLVGQQELLAQVLIGGLRPPLYLEFGRRCWWQVDFSNQGRLHQLPGLLLVDCDLNWLRLLDYLFHFPFGDWLFLYLGWRRNLFFRSGRRGFLLLRQRGGSRFPGR